MPSPPSHLEDHLGYWLRALSHQVSAAFRTRLEHHDVTPAQWVALRCLYDHAPCSLQTLTSFMGTDKGAVSRLIARLVRKSLLTRETVPANRREVVLALTPEGRALVPILAREADENDAAFFGILPERQRRDLSRLVRRLVNTHQSASFHPPLD